MHVNIPAIRPRESQRAVHAACRSVAGGGDGVGGKQAGYCGTACAEEAAGLYLLGDVIGVGPGGDELTVYDVPAIPCQQVARIDLNPAH